MMLRTKDNSLDEKLALIKFEMSLMMVLSPPIGVAYVFLGFLEIYFSFLK